MRNKNNVIVKRGIFNWAPISVCEKWGSRAIIWAFCASVSSCHLLMEWRWMLLTFENRDYGFLTFVTWLYNQHLTQFLSEDGVEPRRIKSVLHWWITFPKKGSSKYSHYKNVSDTIVHLANLLLSPWFRPSEVARAREVKVTLFCNVADILA